MRIVICGAGQIGKSLVHYLHTDHDIAVVDTNEKTLQAMQEAYDVETILGSASNPRVLEKAGVGEKSVLTATTGSDDVNMVACHLAHSLFSAPMKIARLRSETYSSEEWHRRITEKLNIDVILSPELEASRAILKSMDLHYAFDIFALAGGELEFIGVHVTGNRALENIQIRDFPKAFPHFRGVIACIVREYQAFAPRPNDSLLDGDDVYFLTSTKEASTAMEHFGFSQERTKKVIVFGATLVGSYVLRDLEQKKKQELVLVEEDAGLLRSAARYFTDTMLLNGSPLDPDVLEEAQIHEAEYAIAVTGNETTNILVSLMAKRYGVEHSLALLDNVRYLSPLSSLGIEKMVNPAQLAMALLLQRLSKNYVQHFYPLGERYGAVVEAIITPTSAALHLTRDDLDKEARIRFLALMRGNKIIYDPERFADGDHIILMIFPEGQERFQKLFEPR